MSGLGAAGLLTFVRHAMPRIDASRPARDWALSEEGVRAARRLHLPVSATTQVLASTETKAIHTTSIVTDRACDQILVDARFDEVRREEPVDGEYLDRRAAWVGGDPDSRHLEWESFAEVGERMEAAIRSQRSETLIIGTHGMALTAWLVRTGLVAPGVAAVDFWASLKFPELVTVARESGPRLVLTTRTSG